MSNIIRSLMVKVGADLTDLDKSMKKMSKDLKSAGSDMQKTGASLTKGLTVPILGAAAGIAGMAVAAGKGADELITLSNKTGITTQALQEMEYAARFIDVEVETMTSSMIKLTKNMDNAAKGTKDQVEAFERLNVEYMNADGTLRNAKDVWADVIDALGSMSNEADRDAMALRLFGRSAQELNPLIVTGSRELNRLGKEAQAVGAVMSDENVKALGAFDDEMQKLEAVFKTAGAEIGAAFLPLLEHVTPFINEKVVPAVKDFAKYVSDLIKRFTELSPGMKRMSVAALGFATAIGPVLSLTGKLTSTVGGLIGNLGKATKAISSGGGIVKALGALIGPAGVAILAGAAIAGVALAVVEMRKRMVDLSPEAKALTDNIKKQKNAYDELKAAQESDIRTSFLQIGRTQELWRELQNLTDENGNVTDANKKRAEYILNELNTALDLEMQLVDGQITGYKDLQVEIGNLIKIQQAEAVLSAKRAEYEEAVTGWKDRYNEQAALGLEIAERERKINTGEIPKSMEAAYEKQTRILKKTYAENEKIIKEYGETKDEYEKLSAAVTDKNYAEIERITINYGTRLQHYVETQNATQAAEQEASLRRQADIAERAYYDIQRKVYMGEAGVTQQMADAAYEQWQLAETEYAKIGRSIPDSMQDGISEQMPGLKSEINKIGIDLQTIFRNTGISMGKALSSGLNQGRGPIKIDTERSIDSYFKLPSFDVGTPYVPRDMLAMVHKGERIIPADENKHGYFQGGEVVHSGTIRVEGVNSSGELVGVAEIVAKQLDRDSRRRSSGVRFNPIVT